MVAMTDVEVPVAPPMGRVANVELMHTGTWNLSTGQATFTVDDLAAAVGALDCPAVRRPILKLGHTDDPAPGQPAVGFVGNMATAEDGRTLVGDYVGMPGWLVDEDDNGDSVLTSAYPDRSIEAQRRFRCQMGHIHPFVVTAVALLGTERPAIGTIQSLQDLADLYGVAASAEEGGELVTITVHSRQGDVMPHPREERITASVTTEDVRRAFYASPLGDGWSMWVEDIQVAPLQLIVMDDEKNVRSRIPVTVGDGDGQDAVSFGDPVPVVVRFEDVAAAVAASAPLSRSVRFASRRDSRPAPTPAQAAAEVHAASAKKKNAAASATATASTKGAGMDPAKLREGLGLAPDASDEDVNTAMQSVLTSTPTTAPSGTEPAPVAPAAEPVAAAVGTTPRVAGTMVIDASAWDAQQERLKRLEAEAVKRAHAERDDVIAAAVRDGKFPPVRTEFWKQAWDQAPDVARAAIDSLQKNVIPVDALGFADDSDPGIDDEFAHLFPQGANNKRGA